MATPPGAEPATGPRTLALVIGVSRYPELAKAKQRGFDDYGLSELNVSALTAYRVSEWLQVGYRMSGQPLAQCWFLASPTEEEVNAEPGLADAVAPTFRNCEDAVWEWFSAARALSPEDARESRLIFFFSGHGLERIRGEQLLLPSDYLERGLINRAISMKDLTQALAACGIPQQLFLVDACRNDTSVLRNLGFMLTGTQMLNPLSSAYASPRLEAPVLYGSSTGQQAFGPRSVAGGLTLFGQALLQGVTAPDPRAISRDGDRCTIGIDALQEFMNARILDLLTNTFHSDAQQLVTRGGDSIGRFVLSEVACGSATTSPPSVRDTERARNDTVEFVDPTSGRLLGTTDGIDPFEPAGISAIWADGDIRALDGDDVQEPQLTLMRVDRRGTSMVDAVVRLERDPRTAVLTLPESTDPGAARFECYLPWIGASALFRLRLAVEEGRVLHVEADLDPANVGALGRAAETWSAFRERSATVASGLVSADDITAGVSAAAPSPLGLVVAGFVGMAAGRPVDPATLRQAAVISRWPDLTVLRAAAGDEEATRMRPPTAEADLPRTAPALALAWQQVEAAGRALEPENALLLSAVSRLERGGLFPVLRTPPQTQAA